MGTVNPTSQDADRPPSRALDPPPPPPVVVVLGGINGFNGLRPPFIAVSFADEADDAMRPYKSRTCRSNTVLSPNNLQLNDSDRLNFCRNLSFLSCSC